MYGDLFYTIYEILEEPKCVGGYFEGIVDNLKTKRINSGRIIVFCKTYRDVITIFQYFKQELQELFMEPPGSVNCVINRVVDVYTHCTHETVKNKINTQFMNESQLRIVIATIAFGMDINCPDVRHVIHWGVPADAVMYIQESGRGGRDGLLSCTTILCSPADLDS